MKRWSYYLMNFKNFNAFVKHSTTITTFRCDLGVSTILIILPLVYKGTIHQTSCINTRQQNGIAKRKHCHLVKTETPFFLSTDVLIVFWGQIFLQ